MKEIQFNKITYDQFEIRIEVEKYTDVYNNFMSHFIIQSVWINGHNIAPNHPIDLKELVKSCQLSSECLIVTCGCGSAGCAGIDNGILVKHYADKIEWKVPHPLSIYDVPESERPFYENLTEPFQYDTYIFEPSTYVKNIELALDKARKISIDYAPDVEGTPHGFEIEDLLKLDTQVFSERGAPLGCKILAKEIIYHRTPNRLAINGIYYKLNELPVPDEIKALDDWSDFEPIEMDYGYLYCALAAPDEEVARRLQVLKSYITSIQHQD
ncbi:MAG: hypothetical protein WAX04_04905 [Oscillospiraceae bacterium]